MKKIPQKNKAKTKKWKIKKLLQAGCVGVEGMIQ